MPLGPLLVSAALGLSALAGCTASDGAPDAPGCTTPGGCDGVRRGIPAPDLGRIAFPGSGQRSRVVTALEAESPAYAYVVDYVDEINAVTSALWQEVIGVADGDPETEDDGLGVWRRPDPSLDDVDAVLVVSTDDQRSYDLQYLLGPTGFDPDSAAAVVEGSLTFDDDDLSEYELELDFDAAAVYDPAATGTLTVAGHPFAGGDFEVWYDFADFALDGDDGEPLSSRTTYWAFGDDDGGLEYEDQDTTVYARWGSDGGRYDHYASYVDDLWGDVEEIATDCWDGSFAQHFAATAWFSTDDAYGVLDGDEAECGFGPVADHPDPGPSFDDLPGEGEWSAIEDTWIDCDEDPAACE